MRSFTLPREPIGLSLSSEGISCNGRLNKYTITEGALDHIKNGDEIEFH